MVSHIYVDESIGTNTGTGTLADPFGNIGYGIRQTTFDTVNGTQINVKASATGVLSRDLIEDFNDTTVSVAWVGSTTAPIIVRGYGFEENDGGRGRLSGGGLVSIADSFAAQGNVNFGYLHFIDMDLFNVGANRILYLNDHCTALRCRFWGSTISTQVWLVQMDNYSLIHSCKFICDGAAAGAWYVDSGTMCAHNLVDARGATCNTASYMYTASSAYRNTVIVDPDRSTMNGILVINGAYCLHNNVYCPAGTGAGGSGIIASQTTQGSPIMGNVVAGFNGVGGDGITSANYNRMITGNAVYDCTIPYSLTGPQLPAYNDNEILTAMPWVDPDNGNFSPVNTGNMREGSVPFEIPLFAQ